MTTSDVAASIDQPPPMLARSGRAPAATLGRYLLVRFLLIIPTIFILVTLVFFLMRLDRRPDHGGARRPAPGRPARRSASTRRATTGRSSCSTSSTSARSSPATSARRSPTTGRSPRSLVTYGAATFELVFYALIVALRRRHPARPWSPPPRATSGTDAGLRVSAILFYATPVFFAGLAR